MSGTKYIEFNPDFKQFTDLTFGKVYLVRISYNPTPNKVITLDPRYIYIKPEGTTAASTGVCGDDNQGSCQKGFCVPPKVAKPSYDWKTDNEDISPLKRCSESYPTCCA